MIYYNKTYFALRLDNSLYCNSKINTKEDLKGVL